MSAREAKSRIGAAVGIALLLGLLIGAGGMFAIVQTGVLSNLGVSGTSGQLSSADLAGKTTVSEDELDAVLGTYTLDDVTTPVTVREAIEESTSLEAVRNADGSYELPSVDAVLAIARNRTLEAEAARLGIAATDEDTAAYARDTLGTDNYSMIAAGYNMSAEQAKAQMSRSATLRLLRDKVTTTQVPAEPEPPAKPNKGEEDVPMAAYADYILGVVGDEWDKEANSWASEDGPYHNALRDYTISNEVATYSAARAAYDEALVQVATAEQKRSGEWTAYANDLLSNITIELRSLVS